MTERAGRDPVERTQTAGLGVHPQGLLWTFREIVYAKLGVTPLANAFGGFAKGAGIPGPPERSASSANFPSGCWKSPRWGHWVVAVRAARGLPPAAQHLPAIVVAHDRRVLEPSISITSRRRWSRSASFRPMSAASRVIRACVSPSPLSWRPGSATFLPHPAGRSRVVAEAGLIGTLVLFQTYAFYCLVLATGIIVSQLRARRPDPTARLAARAPRPPRSASRCSSVSWRSSTARKARRAEAPLPFPVQRLRGRTMDPRDLTKIRTFLGDYCCATTTITPGLPIPIRSSIRGDSTPSRW